jgi:hypothetical protein
MGTASKMFLAVFGMAAALAPLYSTQAFANTHRIAARSGKTVRITTFIDCTNHRPWQGTAFVDHGTVTYKEGTQSICGNPIEPVREVFYTSNPGFTGVDTVTFPYYTNPLVFSITVH